MKHALKHIYGKVELAKQELQAAYDRLESIHKDDREPAIDEQLNKACDGIFEALEALKQIDAHQYVSMDVGGHIHIMVHRKKTTIKNKESNERK